MKKIITILFLAMFLFSCQNTQTENKKVVYTSFYPMYFLAKSMLPSDIEVKNLVPPWVEPHDFEPSLSQIAQMQNAELIILNWLWMEVYEEKLLEKFWSWKVFLLSENISNLIDVKDEDSHNHAKEHDEHNHWDINPHTWISPKMFVEMAKVLSKQFEEKWYKTDKTIISNLEKLLKDYEVGLANCNSKEIIVSHDAYAYLSRDFSFETHPIMWLAKEQEPSAKDLAEIIDIIKKEKIKYIYTEELVSPKIAETIKTETNTQILVLNPLESLTKQEIEAWDDYIKVMQKNLEKLKLWLECR